MKTSNIEMQVKVDRLLIVLQRQIQTIKLNLSRLNELRAFVVKRDELSLRKLLSTIQSESPNQADDELKRETLRKELAIIFGCQTRQMTLTMLEEELDGPKKERVAQIKNDLRDSAIELRKEHAGTIMLLSECARFNKTLLNGVLQMGRSSEITYSQNGSALRHGNSGFMNLQF
jgi:hypothetical protein